MSGPKLEDGYTRIANELLEAITRTQFSKVELKIIAVIIRKTYGFNKKRDVISLSQMSNLTGINKSNLAKAVMILANKKVIFLTKDKNTRSFELNKNYVDWLLAEVGKTTTKGLVKQPRLDETKGWQNNHNGLVKQPRIVGKTTTKGLVKQPLQKKERQSKDTLKKGEVKTFDYPDWLIIDLWKLFKENRRKLRAPMTKQAEKLAIAKLDNLIRDGYSQQDVINQSIEYGWKGLFPVKGDYVGKNQQDNSKGFAAGDRTGNDWVRDTEANENT